MSPHDPTLSIRSVLRNITRFPAMSACLAVVAVGIMAAPANAQSSGRPDPEKPNRLEPDREDEQPVVPPPAAETDTAPPAATPPENVDAGGGADDERPAATAPERFTSYSNGAVQGAGRPDVGTDPVPLSFKDVPLEEIFSFIAESTGKVVMPIDLLSLSNKKITLLKEGTVPRNAALDLVVQAFQLNGVGVIERETYVIIGLVEQLKEFKDYPVVGPKESVLGRTDLGTYIVKIFQLQNVKATQALDILDETEIPSSATVSGDDNSNQILLYGNVGLAQHIELVLRNLDQMFKRPETRTWRLRHADAGEIEENIQNLFSSDGASTTNNRQRNTGRNARGNNGQAQPPRAGNAVGPEIELRTAINIALNSVTASGDPDIIKEIDRLISTEWDLERPAGTSRIYTLTYVDPVKVAERVNELLGQSSGGAQGGGGRGGGNTSSTADQLSGIYQIEPYPETYQLLVFSKTEDSLKFLDDFISKLDQPTEIGLPFVVELKHANSFELAEQLNALLAEAGARADITAPETGLSNRSLDDVGSGATSDDGAGDAGRLQFPWQQAGNQGDESSPESPLIGRVRIVPIERQNALAILCPRPQKEAVERLIDFFDRPGRQVMLSVIIAEVELTDDFSLGVRLSSSDDIANLPVPDMGFNIGGNGTGTIDNFAGNLFDTSVLNSNVDLNVVLQAIAVQNNIRIVQQPVIFTADNQEAFFFDGQEVPFITNTTITDNGTPTDSFDYRPVGVIFNARPRITSKLEIDLELRLELSAIVPGQTLFGGAILDRRVSETTHRGAERPDRRALRHPEGNRIEDRAEDPGTRGHSADRRALQVTPESDDSQ